MAKHYKKRGGHGKRGLKKGHKKSAAWRKAISEGLKRFHRGGGRKKHRKTRGRKRTRRHSPFKVSSKIRRHAHERRTHRARRRMTRSRRA